MLRKYNIKLYHNEELIEQNIINIIDNKKQKTFILNDIKNTINNNIFIRESNDYKFILNIEDNISTYLLKEQNILYDIKVNKSSISYKDNKIEIIYNIETNDKDIKIILERCE